MRLTNSTVLLALIAACDDPITPTPHVPAGAVTSRAPGNLTAPSGVGASAFSSTQIDISWQDNSQNESGFDVQRSTGPSGTFTSVARTAASAVTYRDQGLAPLAQYCYRVRAVRSSGTATMYSAFGNTACATTPPPPPFGASDAKAVASSAAGVVVSWKDNSFNEDGFRIYRSSDGTVWSLAGTVGPNVTSWVTNQSACYHVVAFNTGGEGAASDIACAIPAPASEARVIAASPTSLTISWTDASTNETGFRVYRSVDGVAWTLAATVGANVTSWFTDQPVCYRVGAFNAYGDAAPSNVACTIPARTGLIAMESGATSVTLSWFDESANEDGFRVYRSSDGSGGWTLAATLAPNTTSWVTNQVACYRVVAFNAAGESPPSGACTMPAAPTSVMLDYSASGELRLSWTDNSAIEDGYRVVRLVDTWGCCNAGGSEPRFLEGFSVTLPPNSTTFSPVPGAGWPQVVDFYTDCDCVYVEALKNWNVASARVASQRQSRRERTRP